MKNKNYVLIFDTGDSVFSSKKLALNYAAGLRRRGHSVDRLQFLRYSGKSYKTPPTVIKRWKIAKIVKG